MDGAAGVTASETSAAAVTVRVVLPEIPPKVALSVLVPGATAVASPALPLAFETVAALGADEAQVTWVVRSAVVASVYVPVAVSCWVVP
jgi:hypothetical protein